MKKNILIASIASTATLVLSTSALAVGYSSIQNPVSGDIPNAFGANILSNPAVQADPVEDHWIQSYTPENDCGAACLGADLQRSELIIHMELKNQSGCTDTGTECTPSAGTKIDLYEGNESGGAFPGQASTAASTQGTGASGNVPIVPKLSLFTPARDGSAAGTGPQYVNLGQDDTVAFSLTDWKFSTSANGGVDGGHIIGWINLGPSAQIVGTFNFDKGTLTTYYGPKAVTPAEHTCLITSEHTAADNCQNLGGNGWILSRNAAFGYINAAENEQDLGKSVPVPAFAAAALGLGLIGITLLSGRRRSIQ